MGIGRGSHEELLSGASSDDIAVAAMMQTALVPGSMAPMATSLGPPSMIPNVVMADATPHSTTVAGTQLLPGPAVRRPLGGQPLALVVGAAASLIVIALVAAIWVGSDHPAETSSAADAPRTARADMDLTSNDDDGGPAPEPNEDSDRSEDDVTDDISIDAIDPPSTSEPEPAVPKTGTMPKPGTVPPPKPTTKSGNDSRPDWGLSPK
jgi:hypothetical protein